MKCPSDAPPVGEDARLVTRVACVQTGRANPAKPSEADLVRVVESATGHPLVFPTSIALTDPYARIIVGIRRPFPRQLRLPISGYRLRFHVKGEFDEE